MVRFRRSCLLMAVVSAVGLITLGGVRANADFITQITSVMPSNGAFTWTYDGHVTSDAMVKSGDYFTIMDFRGYTGTHSEPDGWTFSTSTTGPTPAGLLPTDDPSIANLVWQYTGDTPLTGALDLGQFKADSSIGTTGTSHFVAITQRSTGAEVGTDIGNISTTTVPNSLGFPFPAGDVETPEPSTLALLGLGVPVVLALCRKRRQRSAA
jgi:PEP-CTERM motif